MTVIEIAFVYREKGGDTILRGSPEAVAQTIDYATSKFGATRKLFSLVSGAVNREDEDRLWRDFINRADMYFKGPLAAIKYRIWKGHADDLWCNPRERAELCHFLAASQEMVMTLSPDGAEGWKPRP